MKTYRQILETEQLDSVVIKGVGYVGTKTDPVDIGEMRPGARVNFRPLMAIAKKLGLTINPAPAGKTMSRSDWEQLLKGVK